MQRIRSGFLAWLFAEAAREGVYDGAVRRALARWLGSRRRPPARPPPRARRLVRRVRSRAPALHRRRARAGSRDPILPRDGEPPPEPLEPNRWSRRHCAASRRRSRTGE